MTRLRATPAITRFARTAFAKPRLLERTSMIRIALRVATTLPPLARTAALARATETPDL